MRERKVCRKTYSQTSDSDLVADSCLVNFVVELQFYHQVQYQDSNFHVGPFSFCLSQQRVLLVPPDFCTQVWVHLENSNLQEGLPTTKIHLVYCG